MLLNEHPRLKGFFSYPSYPHVYVTKEGYIYDDVLNRYPTVSYNKNNYPRVSIGGEDTALHRILAETFLDKPKDMENKNLVVNHLDGNKLNYLLSNLEWTTYSGNSIHAYKTGLRSDNQVILLRELGKDEIHEFYSLQETARYLDVNGYKVHAYLKNRFRRRPFLEKYLLTYKGEEWPVEANVLALRPYNCGLPTDIVVTDTEANKSLIIEGYDAVSRYTGIGDGALRYALTKARPQGKTITIGRFKMCYLEDYQPYVDSQLERIKSEAKDTRFKGDSKSARSPKPVLVTDLNTHEQYKLDSSEALANHLGVKKNTLQKYILEHDGVWKNQLRVEYL